MTRQEAGRLGGRATYLKHGAAHMSSIGRRGALTTWGRYALAPLGLSGFAMVYRGTGEVKALINYHPPVHPGLEAQHTSTGGLYDEQETIYSS